MKVDAISQVQHTNAVKKADMESKPHKDFSSVLNVRNQATQGVDLPKNTSKEMIQGFAEWYLKQGKTYESSKSYKMAISAYEKANSVAPSQVSPETVDNARSKAYHG